MAKTISAMPSICKVTIFLLPCPHRSKIFYLLFICIMFLMWLTDFGNMHTYIFFGLAVCLFASIKYFVTELRKVQAAEGGAQGKKAS